MVSDLQTLIDKYKEIYPDEVEREDTSAFERGKLVGKITLLEEMQDTIDAYKNGAYDEFTDQ